MRGCVGEAGGILTAVRPTSMATMVPLKTTGSRVLTGISGKLTKVCQAPG